MQYGRGNSLRSKVRGLGRALTPATITIHLRLKIIYNPVIQLIIKM